MRTDERELYRKLEAADEATVQAKFNDGAYGADRHLVKQWLDDRKQGRANRRNNGRLFLPVVAIIVAVITAAVAYFAKH